MVLGGDEEQGTGITFQPSLKGLGSHTSPRPSPRSALCQVALASSAKVGVKPLPGFVGDLGRKLLKAVMLEIDGN